MKFIKDFDVAAKHAIGTLPKGLHGAADALGWMTLPAVWFGLVALAALFAARGSGEMLVYILVLAALPLATILKLFIRRQRPVTIYAEAMKVKSYSFPSSHAYCAALAGGFFAYLAFRNDVLVVGSILSVLVVIVGVSRVYLGAHYPSDVVAGWIMGLVILGVITNI